MKFHKIIVWEKDGEKESERIQTMENIVNKIIKNNNINEENIISIDIYFDYNSTEYKGKIIERIKEDDI